MGVYALFRERFPFLKTERNFSLSRSTTIGCGGSVSLSVSPSDAEEAAEVWSFLQREHIPYAVLGAGANTLPPEGEQDAVLMRTDMLKGLVSDGTTLYAGAGVTGGALLRFALEQQIGGLEPFVGIPMTVGGACVMNAGVKERHISDVILRVLAVRKGRIEVFSHEACAFGEKSSAFGEDIFVVGAVFRAEPSSREKIAAKTQDFLAKRASLPKGRSMGCVFVNPKGCGAGELIERCGLKGLQCGGAFVSPKHANFIINDGGISDDVSNLIDTVKATVLKKTGILLKEEIRRLTFHRST